MQKQNVARPISYRLWFTSIPILLAGWFIGFVISRVYHTDIYTWLPPVVMACMAVLVYFWGLWISFRLLNEYRRERAQYEKYGKRLPELAKILGKEYRERPMKTLG